MRDALHEIHRALTALRERMGQIVDLLAEVRAAQRELRAGQEAIRAEVAELREATEALIRDLEPRMDRAPGAEPAPAPDPEMEAEERALLSGRSPLLH